MTGRATLIEVRTDYAGAYQEVSSVIDYDSNRIEGVRETGVDFEWETRTLCDRPHYPCIGSVALKLLTD